MSDQDVFSSAEHTDQSDPSGTDNTENNQDTSSTDVFADKLSSIKNEDGTPKYSDVVSALDSIPHAQAHITTIESENAELKEKLAKEQAARELLAKQVAHKTDSPAQQGLTEAEVAAIALKAQQQALEAQSAEANVRAVNATFSELYGDKAVVTMQEVAKDTGMSVAAIRELAKTSPQAVYRLAGINPQTPQSSVPKTPGEGQGDQFTPPRKAEPPKSVMGGSNTNDLVSNWHAAGEIVKQQNQ
jgi:hypothetical protein